MTDFRALCVELVESVEVLLALRPAEARPLRTTEDRLSRARAALADGPAVPDGREPASVTGQPSDEELDELAWNWYSKTGSTWYQVEAFRAFARAALARWGRPAPAAGEVGELVAAFRKEAEGWFHMKTYGYGKWASKLTRAANLLEQRHPAPVPVSERLPGPEDCDAEGRCWLHFPDMGTEPLWRLTDPSLRSRYHSHWLPAHALPLPGQEVR